MFSDPAFRKQLEDLLAAARWGAADPDALLGTAARVPDGDRDAWLREWTSAGGDAWAAGAYLRAAACYGAALALIGGTDGSVAEHDLWGRQLACWDRAIPPLGGHALAVPYAGGALRASFFPAADAVRPLVVVDVGGELPAVHAWAAAGAAARALGYHWMTFERPWPLRPDWEAVLSSVAGAMAARPDVDAVRMAVIGIGHAGYGVTRALAYEHRFAAAAVAPGVLDAGTEWTDLLPEAALAALRRRDPAGFERELRLAASFSPERSKALRRRGRPYGPDRLPGYARWRRVRCFRLDGDAERIASPLLICRRAGERRWPGQAERLHAMAPAAERLVTLGADTFTAWLRSRL